MDLQGTKIIEGLSHLFDAELTYQDELEPVISETGREGVLI